MSMQSTPSTPWTLRDKEGNTPSLSQAEREFIKNIKRELFFPCECTSGDLAMPLQETPPKGMNKFIVFRRRLSRIAEQKQLTYDGKILSRMASYMWNGASEEDKSGYAQIAEELKQRHLKDYPNYSQPQENVEPDFVDAQNFTMVPIGQNHGVFLDLYRHSAFPGPVFVDYDYYAEMSAMTHQQQQQQPNYDILNGVPVVNYTTLLGEEYLPYDYDEY